MLKFKNKVFKFPPQKRSEIVDFVFELEEGELECFTVGCHCTDATYDPETRKITGKLNLAKAVRKGSTGEVDRGITVYEKDGRKIHEVGNDFKYVYNRQKSLEVLTILGEVTGE